MNNFFESYMSREKFQTGETKKKTDDEKQNEVDFFIDSKGMKRWLAKIIFADQVRLIYDSE